MFDSLSSEFRSRSRESAKVLLVIVGHRLSSSLGSRSNLSQRCSKLHQLSLLSEREVVELG